ncbi:MAG: hypothetical protein FWF96_00735 [Kiritimatiellaeota bacterium]|nr:hypothetical protein [Kiritimatiellota bacterium]
MNPIKTPMMALACAAALLAGCGDSGASGETKAAAKKSKTIETAVKLTGDAVADYKATLDKLAEMVPRIHAFQQSESKSPSLAQVRESANWAGLVVQLMDTWKKATPAEREALQAHADTVLEKLPEGDVRNALLGTLVGVHMSDQ